MFTRTLPIRHVPKNVTYADTSESVHITVGHPIFQILTDSARYFLSSVIPGRQDDSGSLRPTLSADHIRRGKLGLRKSPFCQL
jgi:hypothetical protein